MNGSPRRVAMVGVRVARGRLCGWSAFGRRSPSWRTLLRHVWPNITAPIIIIYSITIGWAIIAEASLSFLGFGLPPDVPSWGTMLSREGRQYMEAVHGDGAASRFIHARRATMRGFNQGEFADRHEEALALLATWVRSGTLKYKEQIVVGLENAPAAFLGMLEGANFGKLLVQVSGDPTR